MRKLLLTATALCALAGPTFGQVVEDPLHGCIQGTACTESTIGGNAVTPITSATNFGFFSSPQHSGDLVLKFLIPDNFSLAYVQAFAAAVTVTGISSGTPVLFSITPWTSGSLEKDYLGITSFAAGSPPNPLSAWLGATNTIDPTATGYYVLLADMGQYNIPTPGGTLPDVFSLSTAVYASGGLIVADLFLGDNHTQDVTTAQSGGLFYDPVPGPIVGAGIPGVVGGCLAMLGFGINRRRRQGIMA